MLLNGMYYTTSTLCRCQKDGMYVDMMFSCLNVFLMQFCSVGIILYSVCFKVLDVSKWYALHNINYM